MLVLYIFAFVIISCNPLSKAKDGIVVALDSEPKRINPLFLTDLNSHMVSEMVFKGLISINKEGTAEPALASSWEVTDNGLQIVFHLKRDLFWHDGERFKAEDVAFTYELLNSPEVPSPRKGVLGPVKELKIIDPYTISVTYHKPYAAAVESWFIGILPSHIGKGVIDPSFDDNPIGTGAFKVDKWQRGQFIALKAFDKFYQGKAKIDRVLLRFISNHATRYLELKTAKVDVAELPFYIKTDGLSDKNNRYLDNSFRYTCLGFNLKGYPFKDEGFRRAIAYSINKEELINTVLKGGRVSTGVYPAGTWYYNPAIKPYGYEPERARELLKKLGIESLSFSVLVSSENKELQIVAQFLEQNLKAIGVSMKITLLDWQSLRNRIMEEGGFEAVLLSRAYLWDPDIYDLWHSSKIGQGQWNLFSFKDTEVDSLLERGREALDFNERQAVYRGVHRLLYEKQACIFLYETPLVFYANRGIKGIEVDPRGMLYGVENWYRQGMVTSSLL